MASRLFFPTFSGDRDSITIYGKVGFGATGAVSTTDATHFTIARVSTGKYTLTFADKYPTSPANYVAAGTTTSPLIGFSYCQIDSGNTQALVAVITDDSISSAGTMSVVFNSAANTPADPANGTSILFIIELKNSSTPRKGS